MSDIASILKELNIPEEKLKEFSQRLGSNPMAAMSLVQELNIPPELFQRIIALAMTNPSAILAFAKQMGVSDDSIKQVEDQLDRAKQQSKPDADV
jgi:hypothetical protein